MDTRLSLEQLAAKFEALLELPVAERNKCLEAAQLHDADRSRLARMLRADAAYLPGFLDEPALAHAQALEGHRDQDVPPNDLIGQQFGAFKLVRLLGQGGMATVFLAQRVGADFEQQVAVKLLRRGLYSDIEQKLFRRERRLLANLSHPNIARLIDGGVSDVGIPYLVLEFVEGLRLDRHVEEHRLDLRARLSLFVQSCRAVEAAHRSLIIHRDIKPSNILVERDGTPKLLDFGIAKLLTSDTETDPHHTLTAALTPGYAAPEQLAGGQITTATDVYALGVVLHELLTGKRPSGLDATRASSVIDMKSASTAGLLPLPAEQLKKALRGDLDNIIARSLSSEPERRYPTVTALIADVESYLAGRPVQASSQSRWYAARKFVRRNRAAVATAALLSLGVLVALSGAVWQAQATRVEAHRANAVRDFLLDLFKAAEESQPRGTRVSPEDVVELGMTSVLENAALPLAAKAELFGVLSAVGLSMGALEQTDILTDEGLSLADRVYERDDERWIASRQVRGELLIQQDKNAEAVDLLLPLRDEMLKRGDRVAIETLLSLAVAGGHSGRLKDEESIAMLQKVREDALKNPQLDNRTVLNLLISEVDSLAGKHKFSDALARGDVALAYWRAAGSPSNNAVIWLFGAIGNAASSLGDAERGEAAYRDAIALSEQIHARPHADTAWFLGLLGSYLVSQGKLEEAEDPVMRGLEMRRQVLGESDRRTLFGVAAASRLRLQQGRKDDALAIVDEGIATCKKFNMQDEACVRLLQTRGRMHSADRDFPRAEKDFRDAIGMQHKLTGERSTMVSSQLAYLSELQRRKGDFSAAVETANQALSIMEEAGGGHWGDAATAHLQHAWANLELGRNQQALDELTLAEARYSDASPRRVGIRIAMQSVMARALARLERTAEAKELARTSLLLIDDANPVDDDVLANLERVRDGRNP